MASIQHCFETVLSYLIISPWWYICSYVKKWKYVTYFYSLLQTLYQFHPNWNISNACSFSSCNNPTYIFLGILTLNIVQHIKINLSFVSKNWATCMLHKITFSDSLVPHTLCHHDNTEKVKFLCGLLHCIRLIMWENQAIVGKAFTFGKQGSVNLKRGRHFY